MALPKLIASDLDGTLLLEGSRSVSDRALTLISEYIRRGGVFIAASGRQTENIRDIFSPIKDEIGYICYSGGLCLYRDKVVYERYLDPALAGELVTDIEATATSEAMISAPGSELISPKEPQMYRYLTEDVGMYTSVLNDLNLHVDRAYKVSLYNKDGDIDRIFYFDSPKNDVYPLAQLRSADRELKGFNWKPELRPRGRKDITSLEVRPSERKAYSRHPKATFRQTDKYFPGYMKSVYKGLEDAKARKEAAENARADGTAGPKLADDLPAGADQLLPLDSLATRDSLSGTDSLRAGLDSLALKDSLARVDSLARADSLAARPLTKEEIRAQKRAEAERKRAERIAAREARWDALDARDAEKAAAKAAKKEAREKAKLEKAAARQQKQDLADEAKLQKYIEQYRKRKAREDARAAVKAEKDAAKAQKAAARAAAKAAAKAPVAPENPADSVGWTPIAPGDSVRTITIDGIEYTDKPIIDNGKDTRPISPLHSGGHPEQRGVREPALDPKTAEPAEAPVQGTE